MQSISKEAKQISAKKSPKEALLFFFQEHLKHSVAPTINEDIKEILKQLEPPDSHVSDPELQQHQLQLMFNMQLVECLETQLRQQGRLGATSEAKKLGAIRETAPNAG